MEGKTKKEDGPPGHADVFGLSGRAERKRKGKLRKRGIRSASHHSSIKKKKKRGKGLRKKKEGG